MNRIIVPTHLMTYYTVGMSGQGQGTALRSPSLQLLQENQATEELVSLGTRTAFTKIMCRMFKFGVQKPQSIFKFILRVRKGKCGLFVHFFKNTIIRFINMVYRSG